MPTTRRSHVQARIRRARRPFPLAFVAAAAVLFATPLLLQSTAAPTSAVLGDVSSPDPGGGLAGPEAQAAAVAALAARPDPAGDDSSPAHRSAPRPETLDGYAWPIQNARLTLPFGPSRWGSRIADGVLVHDGIDLATFCGDRITAAHAGTVLAAGRHYDEAMGWIGDLGPYLARLEEKHLWLSLPNVIVIDDGNGYRSIYAHMRKVTVAAGDVVAAGDLIGYEGATGRATGCHLHYGLFSPDEVATFGLDPVAATHMLLPAMMVARIDPLRILPPLEAAGIH